MNRQYKVNGKTTTRELWFHHLQTGDWTIADLKKISIPKVTEIKDDGTAPISAERARQIYNQSRKVANES